LTSGPVSKFCGSFALTLSVILGVLGDLGGSAFIFDSLGASAVQFVFS
jgi:hypothetical protein